MTPTSENRFISEQNNICGPFSRSKRNAFEVGCKRVFRNRRLEELVYSRAWEADVEQLGRDVALSYLSTRRRVPLFCDCCGQVLPAFREGFESGGMGAWL